MKNYFRMILCLVGMISLMGCGENEKVATRPQKPTIAVTYSVLGSVVKELVGDQFEVRVIIPNGLDVHEWEPSAKDVESILGSENIHGQQLHSGETRG